MLAALVLLAMLLVGVLKAKSDAERQWARADQRLQAVAAADALLASWLSPRSDSVDALGAIPIEASGSLTSVADLAWDTRIIDDEGAKRLRCRLVRLSIRDASLADEPVLFTVDLLTAIPAPTQAPDTGPSETGGADAQPRGPGEGL